MSAILPSRTITEPFTVPLVTVMMVALRISRVCAPSGARSNKKGIRRSHR